MISRDSKNTAKKWYIVNTYNTKERKVAENLERRRASYKLEDIIDEIVVAEITKEETKEKRIKKPKPKKGEPGYGSKTREEVTVQVPYTKVTNLYPGYVFIKMAMTDEAWYIIRNTEGVTGFVGSSGKGTKPSPIPDKKVEPILRRIGKINDNMFDEFKPGTKVKILRGPFEGMEGEISEVDKENRTVKVVTYIFNIRQENELHLDEIDPIIED